ncbi:histidine kinase [Hydrogenoanaerobacterium sp.]|uniref:sensor histidine kinase n=1 Tax=Hydrogenoanaerobacterium sp. TaxID=2953763 RepID=UPI0028A0397A|nr:histidine kinase [Hydrogenoanaerobacterium sp.]
MKNKIHRYLVYRAFFILLVLSIFAGLLLVTLAVLSVRQSSCGLFLIGGLLIVFIAIIYLTYKWLYRPYKETAKVLQLFASGYTIQAIYDLRLPISPEVEGAIEKLKAFLNTNELINVTKKQAQYLALQNQINPHFLYNTLEGIRGEAITAGLDNVAKMTEALATFFRYTISNVEHLVLLEDELANIENYYIIQQYRFGERLNLTIDYDGEDQTEVLKYRLPKLILQPIVENSIFHGIERKIEKGNIRIKIEATPKRLIITISDDGLGIEETRLRELNEKLNVSSFDYVQTDNEKKGGIAIVNVNNRIKLLFGEQYGITIYSTLNVGTDVEVTLPLITKNIEGK